MLDHQTTLPDGPGAAPAFLHALGLPWPVDAALTQHRRTTKRRVADQCAHTRQVIKHGEVFAISHTDGDMHAGCECGQGVYYHDTRFLSGLTLRLAGRAPIVLSSSTEHNFFSRVEAMNEAFELSDGTPVKRETLHIARTRLIDGRVAERIEVSNFNEFPVSATLSLELRADFKDLFEVRGFFGKRAEGTCLQTKVGPGGVDLVYVGADEAVRHTAITLSAPPDRATVQTWPDTHETGVRLEWDLNLGDRGGSWALELRAVPSIDGTGGHDQPDEPIGLERLERMHAALGDGLTAVSSRHPGFNAFLQRGTADLTMLGMPTPDGILPVAGVPWFSTPFGRDSVITALQCLPLDARMAAATLRFLARHQGTRVDPFRDEEPGKMLHEWRQGELAATGDVPHSPYYGSIDATPLWLVLLSETHRWTGDLALVRELWPNALRAMAWLDDYADADGDGFFEYSRKSERGLGNQGWKDSGNAILHPDGRIPDSPIALVEVQGYVYDAKRRMGELARALGDAALADQLTAEAEGIKARFDAAFWVPGGNHYAIALDGNKDRVVGMTSNPGHGLWSGIIPEARVSDLVARLMAPDMFNGWGIRTRSADCPNYNPLSYHNGTVWPHDGAIIALGMAHRGHKAEVATLLSAVYETSTHFEYHRLPELFCGFVRAGRLAKPVPYPVACSPQAWSAGTPLMLLTAALGLQADAPNGVLRVVEPLLPDWVGAVSLRDLRVGQGAVDLDFTVADGHTACQVVAVRGELRVEIVR